MLFEIFHEAAAADIPSCRWFDVETKCSQFDSGTRSVCRNKRKIRKEFSSLQACVWLIWLPTCQHFFYLWGSSHRWGEEGSDVTCVLVSPVWVGIGYSIWMCYLLDLFGLESELIWAYTNLIRFPILLDPIKN